MRFALIVLLLGGLSTLPKQSPPAGSGEGVRGNPIFQAGIALDGADGSASVGLVDADRDGDLDLVLVRGNHAPVRDLVLINDGKGTFALRTLHADDRGYGLALADFNGDGISDLAVGNDQPDAKYVYLGDGRGGFTLAGTFGDPRWSTRNIAAADLNGDGRPEIVVANRDGASNRDMNAVCFNDGKGTFVSPCEPLSPESAASVAVADMNGDGALDIIVPHRDGGQSFIYLNDSRGRFDRHVPFGSGKDQSRAIATGDFDGDGHVDIVMGDETAGGTVVYLSSGTLTFAPPLTYGRKRPGPGAARLPSGRLAEPGDTLYAVAVGDVDGDGDVDIVIGHAATPVLLLINDRKGRFMESRLRSAHDDNAYSVAIGDLNGDGAVDIVTAGTRTHVYFQHKANAR